jgi:hypothetical protein
MVPARIGARSGSPARWRSTVTEEGRFDAFRRRKQPPPSPLTVAAQIRPVDRDHS